MSRNFVCDMCGGDGNYRTNFVCGGCGGAWYARQMERLRQDPAFLVALAAVPNEPIGPGRDVEEIFREYRDGAE